MLLSKLVNPAHKGDKTAAKITPTICKTRGKTEFCTAKICTNRAHDPAKHPKYCFNFYMPSEDRGQRL